MARDRGRHRGQPCLETPVGVAGTLVAAYRRRRCSRRQSRCGVVSRGGHSRRRQGRLKLAVRFVEEPDAIDLRGWVRDRLKVGVSGSIRFIVRAPHPAQPQEDPQRPIAVFKDLPQSSVIGGQSAWSVGA